MRCFLTGILLLLSQASWAGFLTYQVEGTFRHTWGTDHLDLHQGQFTYQTTPGEQFSVGGPHTSYRAGERALTLPVGPVSHDRVLAETWITDGTSYDALRFGKSRFRFGEYVVELGQININFAADYFGPGADALPDFSAEDVANVSGIRLDVWQDYYRVATYWSVPGSLVASVATVPEPSTTYLLALGLGALLITRRRANKQADKPV